MKYLILTLLVSVSTWAAATQTITPQNISCKVSKNTVAFAGVKTAYTLYDKNLTDVKTIKCEKVQMNGMNFYTVHYTAELHEAMQTNKILMYEVALLNKKGLSTVRSEVVDEFTVAGEAHGFDLSIKPEWLLSSADKSVQIKISISSKKDKPESYNIKFNPKSLWFEDVF
jgi:hypothetical protein